MRSINFNTLQRPRTYTLAVGRKQIEFNLNF